MQRTGPQQSPSPATGLQGGTCSVDPHVRFCLPEDDMDCEAAGSSFREERSSRGEGNADDGDGAVRLDRASHGMSVRCKRRATQFMSTVSRTPVVVSNAFLDACCRRKQWQLLFSMFCAILAIYTHASSWMSEILFGNDLQSSWLWWTVAVPMYTYLFIYFARFLGAYLGRTWLREISESATTRQAIMTLARGIVQDEEFGTFVATTLKRQAVADTAAELMAAILGSPTTSKALVRTTVHLLQSCHVQEAGIEACTAVMKNPKLIDGLEAFLGTGALTEPLGAQIAGIMSSPPVHEAAGQLVESVLQDTGVKEVVKERAKSLVGDSSVIEAGGRGVIRAFLGSEKPPKGAGHTRGTLDWEGTAISM